VTSPGCWQQQHGQARQRHVSTESQVET
jgi:hypothetical protein